MKGIVFTEFLEMVEANYGYKMVDKIIDESNLPSNGVYTAIGTYDHAEIVKLLITLAENTSSDPDDLLKVFGKYLFNTFLEKYAVFFNSCNHGFDFLESIDKHIHVEVRKIYPDATLPKFYTERNDKRLMMHYVSERKMSALAEGLIESTMIHYNHEFKIEKQVIQEDETSVKFFIQIAD